MAEPLIGITFGIVLYGEHIRATPVDLLGEILGAAAVVGRRELAEPTDCILACCWELNFGHRQTC